MTCREERKEQHCAVNEQLSVQCSIYRRIIHVNGKKEHERKKKTNTHTHVKKPSDRPKHRTIATLKRSTESKNEAIVNSAGDKSVAANCRRKEKRIEEDAHTHKYTLLKRD